MLSLRQAAFVREYLIDLDGKHAAIRAGYAEKSAHVRAHRLLHNPKIIEAIAKERESLEIRTSVTQEAVIQELAAVAFSDLRRMYDANGDLRPLHALDDATAAALAGIETEEKFEERLTGRNSRTRTQVGTVRKVKRWDKVRALELLGKHFGMWGDPSTRVTMPGDGSVVVEVVAFAPPNTSG